LAISELPPEKLRLECPPGAVECKTSEELSPLEGIVGQDRALKALIFGVEMKAKGFNIFAAGPPVTGKRPATRSYLEKIAKTKPTPPDWCYVNNFQNPYEPRALKLPAGKAKVFQKDLKNLIDQVKRAVPAALQSEEFAARTNSITKKSVEQRDKILNELNDIAKQSSYAVRMNQLGIGIVPIRAGKAISQEEYDALPASAKKKFEQSRETVRNALDKAGKQVNELEVNTLDELKKLRDDTVHYAMGGLISTITFRYQDEPDVVQYLDDLRDDVLENTELFTITGTEQKKDSDNPPGLTERELPDFLFRRYQVNVIVDNSDVKGAPVIAEDNPTVTNLLGRIENEAKFGTLSTDFTLIKGGSIHKANGGFLILGARELLTSQLSYEGLKRALQNGNIAIEETGQRLGVASTKSLTPQPIPLDVKIVLAGDNQIYQALYVADPDFGLLFKVKAQFDDTIERSDENMKTYGRFVHTLCEKENLNHLEASAIAKVVEYGSRLAEDQSKLSTKFPEIADLVREANLYSTKDESKYIKETHILKALQEKIYRSNLLDEKTKEMIERGVILIDTSGAKIGQVNGLSVISLGDFDFGQPSRITASVGLGREGVIDVERQAKLGGQTHTKGVLIISGYLENKYARDKPLSVSARLVFEQSYGGVDGDSASSTELYAILSALSELPIKQNFAVTGSVNQKGEVQAIGGVNEKIEGFYHTCRAKGLKGNEGVLIPRSNIQHLMLSDEVVEAVKQGRFHIYPVGTIDEGIEILTGVKAGALKGDEGYEADTVHFKVNKRLAEMASEITRFGQFTRRPSD
jgi:lon-related putative ATP-dependent protease